MRLLLMLFICSIFGSIGCLGAVDTFQSINTNQMRPDGGGGDGAADNTGGVVIPGVDSGVAPDMTSTGTIPGASDAVSYNIQVINSWRAQYGLAPVELDGPLKQFATEGSEMLASDCPQPLSGCSSYHRHYQETLASGTAAQGGFCNGAGENQGTGVVSSSQTAIQRMIKTIIDNMMTNDASWNWAHRDVIINPNYRKVGIGLVFKGNMMFLTNDFTGACY